MTKILRPAAVVSFIFLFSSWVAAFTILGVDHPRVMIFAPHPDDEILGTAGIIKAMVTRAKHDAETDLNIVIMTCGDAYEEALAKAREDGVIKTYRDLGARRHQESLAALYFLGVGPDQVTYLGYPDGGMGVLFESLPGVLYKSKFTETSKVPYDFALEPGAPYTHDGVVNRVRGLIQKWKPNLILTPTLTDQHRDHSATRKFVVEALAGLSVSIKHLEYLIHWEHTEDGWPHNTKTWDTPEKHVPADLNYSIVESGLTPDDKARAIGFHSTQIAVMGTYLLGFAKETESFWHERAAVDAYAAPAPGLWQRFKRSWKVLRGR